VATDADCDGTLTAADCDDNDASSNTISNDADCDGYTTSTDCDDNDDAIFPFAGDILGDGIDGDCDGMDCEASNDGSTYFAACQTVHNWTDARSACQGAGYSDLATILDAAENSYVLSLLSSIQTSPWIGFNDSVTEGSFGWTSGYGVSYTNWYPGEPNDSGGEDCTHIYNASSTYPGYWNDAKCLETSGYVCELR
jgi:hypothetical protein